MNRRNFVGNIGLLGAAALLPFPVFSMPTGSKYKLGLQLFSINNEMNSDPIPTLEAVKAMGYEDFEIYGFDGEQGTFYNVKASRLKKALDELQLTVSSGHFGFAPYLEKTNDELKRFVDQCIEGAYTLEMSYITWPWIAPEQRTIENYKLMSNKLNLIGEQVTGAGLGFAYHNQGFEFTEHNGETGFDIILQETDPSLVKLQMDMFWVMNASKYTPKQLVKDQPGRYVMWHIKDMDKVTRDYTELGNGSIDYTQILPDPAESGLEFFYLEQGGNFTHSPMQSVAESADFFKKNLQQYL